MTATVQAWIQARVQAGLLAHHAKLALLIFGVPLALYLALFAPISPLHDALHPLRHSLTLVSCH